MITSRDWLTDAVFLVFSLKRQNEKLKIHGKQINGRFLKFLFIFAEKNKDRDIEKKTAAGVED